MTSMISGTESDQFCEFSSKFAKFSRMKYIFSAKVKTSFQREFVFLPKQYFMQQTCHVDHNYVKNVAQIWQLKYGSSNVKEMEIIVYHVRRN